MACVVSVGWKYDACFDIHISDMLWYSGAGGVILGGRFNINKDSGVQGIMPVSMEVPGLRFNINCLL